MSYHSKKSFGQRFSGLIVVAVLHVIVLTGLIFGLGPHESPTLVANVKVKTVEEQKQEVDTPPPPPPDYVPPPPPVVKPPEFNVATEVSTAPTTAINTTAVAQPTPPPAAPAAKTGAKMPPGGKGISKPTYPSESIKLNEEGTVGIAVLVGTNGKVEDSKVEKSSGFARLDEAVLKESKKWKNFVPCMEGATPVACWYSFNMKMVIEKK